MPDVTIEIGGRAFTVACQDGEESYLSAAAALLDREAQQLVQAGSRLTPDRMLLMAGLMLADKSISAEEELRTMDRRLAQQTRLLDELQAQPTPEPVEVIKEVPVEVEKVVEVEKIVETISDEALARLKALADRAEALAAQSAERSAS
ncbi:cell division protein ZapA [Jannaschia seohaensis]|uniref:Cell division protein ZapA n=1 Tax=Jannaschia seohaensis TaxID=475081 RepID=A0A2Y9AP25_9RHOB|nr:cell division protein ZapA [Jannaschia seohaensis]PWJ19174.1 cell division protein ZapA [Jannaschia seohaensis]SSA45836.1 cell division protein ZapA [Jannaschia seohaensis]